MSALPVFHLDDPDVRIEAHLARQARFHFRFGAEGCGQDRDKTPLAGAGFLEGRLWSRRIEGGGAVEPRYLDKDRAGFLGAAAAHHSKRAFQVTAAYIGRNPDRTLQPQQATYSTGAPVTNASSSVSLSLISPALASPRSRSNFSMALRVAASGSPLRSSGP